MVVGGVGVGVGVHVWVGTGVGDDSGGTVCAVIQSFMHWAGFAAVSHHHGSCPDGSVRFMGFSCV